ncbi:hypothetical protein [Obesumbacterium proteus]|uniref:hypothetical protein n=1 Tax=Obesumbacterium proteus TaxID=82983 RepID=UPI001F24EB1E|nr:hypothetical protein [Obesumbacterium proteus]MCE9886521.1 hypothetical protein [Obesumbacterium proteus]
MAKLTTEITIDELQYRIHAHENDLTQMWTADYFLSVQKELLALKQAAKNPVAWDYEWASYITCEGPQDFNRIIERESPPDWAIDEGQARNIIPLYAAPVLPKQPELVENLKKVMNSWLAMEPKLAFQPEFTDVMMLLDAEPHELKIPPAIEPDYEVIKGILPTANPDEYACCVAADMWNACRAEMLKAQQNEPQNIPENIPAQPVSEPYKSAANDIIAERQRQIREEGWTPERDDSYSCGELAGAAACYARYTNARGWVFPTNPTDYQSAGELFGWPWGAEWWKPTNPRRDLVKAGALILAEIERLDRAAPAQESE